MPYPKPCRTARNEAQESWPLFPQPNRRSHCPHLAKPHTIREFERQSSQSWLYADEVVGCPRKDISCRDREAFKLLFRRSRSCSKPVVLFKGNSQRHWSRLLVHVGRRAMRLSYKRRPGQLGLASPAKGKQNQGVIALPVY